MKKTHCRQNRKGSVLLTVICFTMVCILLASAALNDARTSVKQSNASVQKTQAQVTAEDYLKEYLTSFGGSYDTLATLAGTDVSHPNEVEVQLQDAAGNVIDPATAGGSCKLYIYNSASGGIVVKSQVNYGSEVETSSAYFSATTPSSSGQYDSTSAIETMDGMTGYDKAYRINGDAIIETSNTGERFTFHNSQANASGHMFANCNMLFSEQTDATVRDTVDGKAATLTSNGYIFWQQTKFTTDKGKYDVNYKKSDDGSYDSTNLSNRDGYILTDKKFINLGVSPGTGNTIGTTGKPIDVYCHGAYFGSVPTNVGDYSAITGVYNGSGLSQTNPCTIINGNLYSYKGSNPTTQNGDVYINSQNSTINGDVVIDGDLYIGKSLTINGNLYCTGHVYVTNELNGAGAVSVQNSATINSGALNGTAADIAVINNKLTVSGTYSSALPAATSPYSRCKTPDMNYDAAKFDPTHTDASGNLDKLNPGRNSPNAVYTGKTANDMFRANNADSKYIANKYTAAYNYEQTVGASSSTWEESTYLDEACTKSLKDYKDSFSDFNTFKNTLNSTYSHLYVKGNYKFDNSKLSTYFNNPDNVEYTVKMQGSEDVVMILPSTLDRKKITVDFSGSDMDTSESPTVPKNFCYFMLDCGATGANYSDATPSASTWRIDSCRITDSTHTNPGTDFTDSLTRSNNLIMLVPDNCDAYFKSQNSSQGVQSIVYATGAKVHIDGPASSQPVFGQLLTNKLALEQNDTAISRYLPSRNSILDFIYGGSGTPATTPVSLQYFIRSMD